MNATERLESTFAACQPGPVTLCQLATALGIQRDAAAARMRALTAHGAYVVSRSPGAPTGRRGAPAWAYSVTRAAPAAV